MCSANDNEIKHINKTLDKLVEGQERNDAAHIKIAAHVAVSVERWEEQKRLNEQAKKDLEKTNDKISAVIRRSNLWNSANSLLATIAGYIGVNQ